MGNAVSTQAGAPEMAEELSKHTARRATPLSVSIEVHCYLTDQELRALGASAPAVSRGSKALSDCRASRPGCPSSNSSSSSERQKILAWTDAFKLRSQRRSKTAPNKSTPSSTSLEETNPCPSMTPRTPPTAAAAGRDIATKLSSSCIKGLDWTSRRLQSLQHSLLPSCLTPRCSEDAAVYDDLLSTQPQLGMQEQQPTPDTTAASSCALSATAAAAAAAVTPQAAAAAAAAAVTPQAAAAAAAAAAAVTPQAAAAPAAAAVVPDAGHDVLAEAAKAGESELATVPCIAEDSSGGSTSSTQGCSCVSTGDTQDKGAPPTAKQGEGMDKGVEELQSTWTAGAAPIVECATASAESWGFGHCSVQNARVHMEDRLVSCNLTGHAAFPHAHRAGVFAVFDGHGGEAAAQHLASHMVTYIVEQGPHLLHTQPLAVLGSAIHRAEASILGSWTPEDGAASGSTLCLCLLVDDTLHVAHVGDSRAVLARGPKSVPLTRDHKPTCSVETERIQATDPDAHVSEDGYLYGELGVSRGLGSAHIKSDPAKTAYVASPELVTISLEPTDDFVVLATDGLWDKVGSADAVNAARRSLAECRDPTKVSELLVQRAQKLGSGDNISVVLLLLHDRQILLPKSNSRLFSRATSQVETTAASAGMTAEAAPRAA